MSLPSFIQAFRTFCINICVVSSIWGLWPVSFSILSRSSLNFFSSALRCFPFICAAFFCLAIRRFFLKSDKNPKIYHKYYLKPESTISAINSTARYGLENLNNTHDVFSVGFAMTHPDSAIISAPDAIAVYR